MIWRRSLATSSLFALCRVASAVTLGPRDTSTFGLYAYGENISGLNVFYGDGYAYVGLAVPTFVAQSVNITFTSGSNSSTPWTITANSTSTAFNTTKELYIIPTSGAFDVVGFYDTSSGTLPTGAVTSKFNLFGREVFYQDATSAIAAQFWATTTNQTGVWALKWNSDGTDQTNSIPVALKADPPAMSSLE